MFLHKRSISAVLPDPTGPPTPTRRGPWDLLAMFSPPSSRRRPGPITTKGNCCETLEFQRGITTNICDYGSRPAAFAKASAGPGAEPRRSLGGDGSPRRRKKVHHDLNSRV